MFNKIFLVVFVVALLVMSILTYLCFSQLQSIGFPPAQIVQNFDYFEGLHKNALWISSLALLVLANIILWMNRKSWAIWLTFAYFAVFIMLNTWWLSETLSSYNKLNNLPERGVIITGILGAMLCIIVGVGIFFNQFLILRLRDKMYNKPDEQTEIVAEKITEEESISEEKTEDTSSEDKVEEIEPEATPSKE